MALFVRNGGSRHTGQAAPPQRNIHVKGVGCGNTMVKGMSPYFGTPCEYKKNEDEKP